LKWKSRRNSRCGESFRLRWGWWFFLVGEGHVLEALESPANCVHVLLGCPVIDLHLPEVTQAFINEPDALAQLPFEGPETFKGGIMGGSGGVWIWGVIFHRFGWRWGHWVFGFLLSCFCFLSGDGRARDTPRHDDELTLSPEEDGIAFVGHADFGEVGVEGPRKELGVEEDPGWWSFERGVFCEVGDPLVGFLVKGDEADFVGVAQEADGVTLQSPEGRDVVLPKGEPGKTTADLGNDLPPVRVVAFYRRDGKPPGASGELDHGGLLFPVVYLEPPVIAEAPPLEKGRGRQDEGLLDLQALEKLVVETTAVGADDLRGAAPVVEVDSLQEVTAVIRAGAGARPEDGGPIIRGHGLVLAKEAGRCPVGIVRLHELGKTLPIHGGEGRKVGFRFEQDFLRGRKAFGEVTETVEREEVTPPFRARPSQLIAEKGTAIGGGDRAPGEVDFEFP